MSEEKRKKMAAKIDAAIQVLDDVVGLAQKNPVLARILKEAKLEAGVKGTYTVQYTIHDKSYEVIV